jgi:hypothetical protein
MPAGGPLGRAITNSQGAFVTPIVTNNPVFQVKLASVDDRMEQKAGDSDEMQDKIKRGDKISGTPIGEKPREKQKKRIGLVQNIIKDANGNETAYVITDEDGDQIKIDPSSAAFIDMHDTGREAGSAEKYKMTESKVAGPAMLFEQWKANRLK